jgi:hypothetical protein
MDEWINTRVKKGSKLTENSESFLSFWIYLRSRPPFYLADIVLGKRSTENIDSLGIYNIQCHDLADFGAVKRSADLVPYAPSKIRAHAEFGEFGSEWRPLPELLCGFEGTLARNEV